MRTPQTPRRGPLLLLLLLLIGALGIVQLAVGIEWIAGVLLEWIGIF